jgi:hypothetical protein
VLLIAEPQFARGTHGLLPRLTYRKYDRQFVFVDHGLETIIITSLQSMSEGMVSDPTSLEKLALGFEQEVSTCGLCGELSLRNGWQTASTRAVIV